MVSIRLLTTCVALLTSPYIFATDIITLKRVGKGVETVSAKVAGHDGTYLFDTGIGTSGVTPDVARAMGCTPWGKVTGFRATGERLDLPKCNTAEATLGKTTTRLAQWSVFDLQKFMGPASQGLSGALGLDLFADKVVTLDLAEHKVVVEDERSYAAIRAHAVEVPLRTVRAAEGAALTVDLGLPTSSGLVWMEVDTGNYGPSLVDKTVAPLFGLDASSMQPQPFKSHVAKNVDIDDRAIVKSLIMDGNLGRGVLHHWQLTLDLAGHSAWIVVKPPTFNEKVESMAKQLGS